MARDRQNLSKIECLRKFESKRRDKVSKARTEILRSRAKSQRSRIKFFKVLSVIVFYISINQVSLAIEAELKAHDQETKDYGIVGHTYPIIEQDIIEYIKNRLGQIDLNVLETETKVRVQEKIKRPTPVYGITKAKENHEYDYDPTFTLEENIEDHKGNIIYPKGTTINPLSSARMKEALIFIDGDDKAQAEYAIEKYKERGGKVKIILIKGSPIDLGLKHKDEIQFYFDQEGVLTNKLGIKHVPAIVNQDGLKLRIKEVLLK